MLDGYGLTIFSGGRGAERFRRAAEIAALAEAAGFGAVWTGELYNPTRSGRRGRSSTR